MIEGGTPKECRGINRERILNKKNGTAKEIKARYAHNILNDNELMAILIRSEELKRSTIKVLATSGSLKMAIGIEVSEMTRSIATNVG